MCGRTFSYVMLEALTGTDADTPGLDAGLARLLDAEILFQRGPGLRAAFTWKHALLREAAYESLPDRERRRLHERAARALLELEPTNCALHPQEVASHWTEAGHHQEALEWWRRAGLRALERSAYEEADRLFDRALRSLRRTPNNADRRRRELDLRLDLTSLEMGRHGPASAQAARQAGMADKLCAGLPLDDEVARAILLSARVRFARGEMRRTLRILEPLRAFDDRIQNPYLRASVLTQAANLLTSLGRLDESDRFQNRAIEAYGQATERPAGVLTTDPLAHLLITRASNEWLRGRAGESTRSIDQAIAHTERLGHPFSRAMILVLAASLSMRRRDWVRFRALIDDAARAAAAVGSYWLIDMSNVMAPLADMSLDPAARAERLRAALAVPPGTRLYRSVPMAELADVLASLGHERRSSTGHGRRHRRSAPLGHRSAAGDPQAARRARGPSRALGGGRGRAAARGTRGAPSRRGRPRAALRPEPRPTARHHRPARRRTPRAGVAALAPAARRGRPRASRGGEPAARPAWIDDNGLLAAGGCLARLAGVPVSARDGAGQRRRRRPARRSRKKKASMTKTRGASWSSTCASSTSSSETATRSIWCCSAATWREAAPASGRGPGDPAVRPAGRDRSPPGQGSDRARRPLLPGDQLSRSLAPLLARSGLAFQLPTATEDQLGAGKWQVAPTLFPLRKLPAGELSSSLGSRTSSRSRATTIAATCTTSRSPRP